MLNEFNPENDLELAKLTLALSSGHMIVTKGELTGPYLTYTTFHLSNGESITIKSASSLHWVNWIPLG